jgi:hypothetical protein
MESDAEFLDSMEAWVIGSLVFKAEHRERLFDLARRGAEAADRIKKLEAALREIEYLDRPQVRGLPRRVSIQEIARAALEASDE